jgi:ABC-2 type transport system permease protein
MFALLLPFLIVIIFGSAIEFNLENISLVIVDHDKSRESSQLADTIGSSSYFKVYFRESPEAAMNEILDEKAKAALIIPPHFNRPNTFGAAEVQLLVDGADNSSMAAMSGYMGRIAQLATEKIFRTQPQKNFLQTRFLFNHELNSKWFMIPGLSAVIIALVAILLTSLTICREYEHGSLELLLSTPVRSMEIIAGKILPYAFLGWIGFSIVYAAARLLYEIPFCGSHWILLLGTAIFILDYLAIGLYISIVAKQQQLAVQMAMIVGLLPTMLLSGFVFPLEYMPKILQYITMIFPARWYIEIARGEFLKASSFADLATPFAALVGQGIVVITMAFKKFGDTLE